MSLYPQICLVNGIHLDDMKYFINSSNLSTNIIQNYHITVVTINARYVSR